MDGLSDEVRSFIRRYLDSVARLEVLLLLQGAPERSWTAGEVSGALQLGSEAADKHLAKLCAANLLEARVGSDIFYRYLPRPEHLAQAAQAVARAYSQQRLAVLELFSSKPDPMREFGDAFRLKKKDDSDG